MKTIGITGQSGFVGLHLSNTLTFVSDKYKLIPFHKDFFVDENLMDDFVSRCDIIVHLAAVNRHADSNELYSLNLRLSETLLNSLIRTKSSPHLIFSSSIQEENDSSYGLAKKACRLIFERWASSTNSRFTALILPNVFGPFCKPFHNSVVSTFSFQLLNGQHPLLHSNVSLPLIYVGDLVRYFIEIIEFPVFGCVEIPPSKRIGVSSLLDTLNLFKNLYILEGIIPDLSDSFTLNLFNTFRSYIELNSYFPRKYIAHTDSRGRFFELVKPGVGGQTSFSITHPVVTRGNHFHTRKVERFCVIKGKALVQLRRVDTSDIIDIYMDGDEFSYIDIPIWFTHNIKNIGTDELYTVFWISEPYSVNNSDTYYLLVK